MEDDLTAALLASAGLTALVGENIHWKRTPDRAALPSINMHRISVGRTSTLSGLSPTTGTRVQFDCWAGTDAGAGAVRDALLEVLKRLNEAPLQVAILDDPPDYWTPGEGPDGDRSTDLYRQSLECRVWHRTA